MRTLGIVSLSAAGFWGITLSLIITQASAGEVTGSVYCDRATKNCLIRGLAIKGEIDDKITADFSRLIDTFNRQRDQSVQSIDLSGTTIKLNSPGGSVPAAMAIGRLLRTNRMTASVDPYASCLSSCVLIYAGAVARFGYNVLAKIGIHQPYFQVPNQKIEPDTVRKNYNALLLDIRTYLREMNVSERLADEMMKTPPSSVRYLTEEEQESFGLSMIDPIERETSALIEAQKLGLDRKEYNRRETLSMKACPLDSNFSICQNGVMNTGSSNASDLSKFGTPVE
jgi:ATP-dependent protease ClpP protease subunit